MKTSHQSLLPPPPPKIPTTNLPSFPILTFSCCHNQVHHTQSIQGHPHLGTKKMKKTVASIDHDHPRQKKRHSQESSLEKNGSGTFRGWNPWSTIASQDWQVGKLSPPPT